MSDVEKVDADKNFSLGKDEWSLKVERFWWKFCFGTSFKSHLAGGSLFGFQLPSNVNIYIHFFAVKTDTVTYNQLQFILKWSLLASSYNHLA